MSANSTSDVQKYADWKAKREPNIEVWQNVTYFQKAAGDSVEELKWCVKVESNRRDEFCVYFSNFVEVWSEELTFDDFETKLQAFNPNLECGDAKTFTQFVKELIVGRLSSNITLNFDDDDECNMKIQYRTKYSGCPFRWEYNGCKCSPLESKRLLMDSVLILLSQFQRRETDLMDQLIRKDREIEAYKMTGAKLTRKNLETEKFNAEVWSKNDEQSQVFLDACRNFRNEREHPFQDLKIRLLLTATETGMQFLDACQLEDVENQEQNDESSVEAESSSVTDNVPEVAMATVTRLPAKRAASRVEEPLDDEPDTTTLTNEKRSLRKKKLMKL